MNHRTPLSCAKATNGRIPSPFGHDEGVAKRAPAPPSFWDHHIIFAAKDEDFLPKRCRNRVHKDRVDIGIDPAKLDQLL